MNAESSTIDPYEAVLSDLRAKRDQIDQAIAVIMNVRGSGGSPPPSGAPVSSATPSHDQGIVETAGMFLGMSIVDATKKLLAMRKRTMGNVEISRELQNGGLALGSADPVNTIGSVLTRRFNQIGDVVKVGRGIWGLKEWYPNRSFKTSGKNITIVTPAKEGGSNDMNEEITPNPESADGESDFDSLDNAIE